MSERIESVEVDGGAVPVHIQAPENESAVPGLVVVPSIYGPAPDLLKRLSPIASSALVVVADPFWRKGGGVVPYDDPQSARARLEDFDRDRCFLEMRAVIDWTRTRCNGHVAGLGICFGGPIVLLAAGEGALDGVITWHGARMENCLERAADISGPLRFHFGSADPVSPPEAIEQISAAFASHPDVSIVVHPDLQHGFSHEGSSYNAEAAQAGTDDVAEVLAKL